MDVPVAVFDLDKTLTVRDCVFPFMRRVAGLRMILWIVIRRFSSLTRAVMRRDRDTIKSIFVRGVFTGADVAVVQQLGVDFAEQIASSWIRDDVAQRLRWHQEQDHVVLIVSASLAPYVEPLGDILEVDGTLCTELEEEASTYTGEIVGKNCRGVEKVVRIEQWCADAGLPISSLQYAYGDSAGDEPMIERAACGERVTRRDVERVPTC